MKKMKIDAFAHRLNGIGMMLAAGVLCVCCSESDSDAMLSNHLSEGDTTTRYDSTYNAAYNLYVVDDDTTAYTDISDNVILNNKEKTIGIKLAEYAVKMLVDYGLDNTQNMILSPMSATMLYSMMSNFTSTDNNDNHNEYMEEMELDATLESDLNSYQRKINEIVEENEDMQDDETCFSVENDMLMKAGKTVFQSFLSTTRAYKVNVKGVNFSNTQEVSQLNNSIRSKVDENNVGIGSLTSSKIESFVSSALSFKQFWKYGFSIDSTFTVFAGDNGITYQRKMLTRQSKERFNFFDNFGMLELPYKGDKYSMLVVLPNQKKTLAQTLAELKKASLNHCAHVTCDTTRSYHGISYNERMGKTGLLRYKNGVFVDTVYVADTIVVDTLETDTILKIRMPEFKYSGTVALNNSARNSSKQIYSTNLGKVSPHGFTLGNIYQSCCIEVTCEGTKATAKADIEIPIINTGTINNHDFNVVPIAPSSDEDIITYVRFTSNGERTHNYVVEDFCINRPFIVFIRENNTGSILFSACIKTLND